MLIQTETPGRLRRSAGPALPRVTEVVAGTEWSRGASWFDCAHGRGGADYFRSPRL